MTHTLHENKKSILANCPGCNGAQSTFTCEDQGSDLGSITQEIEIDGTKFTDHHRLYKCLGCGRGAFGVLKYIMNIQKKIFSISLEEFFPIASEASRLPSNVPEGISKEFKEAERCLNYGCYRAAAGLFRSVLDKTMRENGYKKEGALNQQIDAAAKDGVITDARKNKAHSDIRVLGNDVLHDSWVEIPKENVEAARHYCQRILEDFYDDRISVEGILQSAGRL